MAIFSLNIRPIGKTTHKAGTAAAHIRYITRKHAASKVLAKRMPDRPGPAQNWINNEEAEDRKNARIADRVMFALPIEISHDERSELVEEFAEKLSKGRTPWIAAIHDKGKDVDNPHCHLMIRDRDHDTGKRVIMMSEKGSAQMVRELWEKTANVYLERNGYEARIDRRSLKEQGIEREAQIHEGVKGRALQEKGKKPLSRTREKGDRKIRYRSIDRGRSRVQRNQEIKSKIDRHDISVELTKEQKLARLRTAHDRVKMYRRHEQHARDAGTELRDRNRSVRSAEWKLDRAEETREYHEMHLDGLLGAYQNPKQARQRLEKLAKEQNLDALTHRPKQCWKVALDRAVGRGRFSLGQKRGFAMFKPKYKMAANTRELNAAQVDRAILYRYIKIREAEAEKETRSADLNYKKSRANTAKQDYERTKSILGEHRIRAEAQRRLYGERREALKDVTADDIWTADMAQEDKNELARLYEEQLQREAQREADRQRYKRQPTPKERSRAARKTREQDEKEEGKSYEALLLTAKERRQQRHDRLRAEDREKSSNRAAKERENEDDRGRER